nr:MAG TPA: hypothetical protein [Bacteriophage sp.]
MLLSFLKRFCYDRDSEPWKRESLLFLDLYLLKVDVFCLFFRTVHTFSCHFPIFCDIKLIFHDFKVAVDLEYSQRLLRISEASLIIETATDGIPLAIIIIP